MSLSATQPVPHGPAPGTVWAIFGVIAAAGAFGGLINVMLGNPGTFKFPKSNHGVVQLGVVGNVVIGAFAAVTTWGLYGRLKDAVVLGTNPGAGLPANLTVTALIGAALAGPGGAKVISNEIDKPAHRVTSPRAPNSAS